MSQQFSNQYLADQANRGEIDISEQLGNKLLFVRFGLNTVSGTAIYDFPIPGIIHLRRVTWLGHKVWPLTLKEFEMEYGIRPASATSQSRPFYYVLQGYGTNQIRFYPTPNQTITASGNVYGPDIVTNVVISAYRVADPTNNVHIPGFILRRLVRYYVQWRCFLKEGKTQNIQAAKYFEKKYEAGIADLKFIMNKVPRAINNQMGDSFYFAGDRRPARPQPPPEYGVRY